MIGPDQSPGIVCWKIFIDGYHKLWFFFELQFNNLPLPIGNKRKVFFPNAPDICALTLLQDIIKSQALIIEETPRILL